MAVGARFWVRWVLVAAVMGLPGWVSAAQLTGPDLAGWFAERRKAAYEDLPKEIAAARAQFGEAQRTGNRFGLKLWGGWYLKLTSGRVLVSDLTSVYDAVAADVAQPGDPQDNAAVVAALTGMVRYETAGRDLVNATRHAAQALQLAEPSPALVAEAHLSLAFARLEEAQASAATVELVQVRTHSTDEMQLIEARILQTHAALYAAASNEDLLRVTEMARQAEAEMNNRRLPWAAMAFAEWEANTLARAGRRAEGLERLLGQQRALARDGMDAAPLVAYRVSRASELALALALAYRESPKDSLCAPGTLERLKLPDIAGVRISMERLAMLCRAAARDPQAIPAIRALEAQTRGPVVTGSAAIEESIWSSIASAYALVGNFEDAHRAALQYRRASLRRVGEANEVARAEIESRYQVAEQRRENEALRSRQAIEEQRRLFMGVALGILAVALAIVGWLLRIQTQQRRRLAQTSAELAQANERLTSLNASRSRMLAAACHDLRQPAHAIGLLSEVLAQADAASSVGSLKELRRASAVLADMLDLLIDMTQLESDRYEPRIAPVPMSELLLEVQAQFTRVAERKGLMLQVDTVENLWALTDRHLLRRMLFNLVSNAIKYTRRGRVLVRCEPSPEGLRIAVEDTGVGIPPEKQQDIFREFVRLDTLREAEPGLGIGLSVAARAARLLGLSIQLESTVGQGSVFSVSLPRASEALAVDAAPEVLSQPLRIVVMEDDSAIRGAMCKLLAAAGHTLHDYASPSELQAAIEAGELPRPDLVISDLHLGGANGLDAIARLREQPGWQDTPALLLTGDLAGRAASRAAEMGVLVAYKPLPKRRLFEAIARATAVAEGGAP